MDNIEVIQFANGIYELQFPISPDYGFHFTISEKVALQLATDIISLSPQTWQDALMRILQTTPEKRQR